MNLKCNMNKDAFGAVSNTISALRFPLAVMVIVLHCGINDMNYSAIGLADLDGNFPIYCVITWILGHFISNVAVPVFFIISGFLLFYNVEKYNAGVYGKKMKKRVKSLLVPYLCWNTLYLALFYLIGHDNILLTSVPDMFADNVSIGKFLCIAYVRPPVDGPLWFIRNLFCMTLAAPLFYYVISKTKFWMPIILLILSQFSLNSFLLSILWFSIGISCAVHKFDFFKFCRMMLPFTSLISLIVLVVDVIYFKSANQHISDHFYIFRIMLVIGIAYFLVEKKKVSINKRLNQSTFVVYAYHSIPSQMLIAFLVMHLKTFGQLGLFATYVLSILLLLMGGQILSIIIHQIPVLRKLFVGR